MNFKLKILLFLVILLGFFLRIYNLEKVPPSLFSDEVDAGYQALAFNHCLSDYFGTKTPTHFKSIADYRTALPILSISLSQKLFGTNDFSVRFPSVFFGTLSILIFYLIGKIIYKSQSFGLILAFTSSINPWLIHYSRTAFEVSTMLFVILLSIYFWLIFLEKQKNLYLLLCLVSLLSSAYIYSTAKLYIFLIGIYYLTFSFKQVITIKLSKLILIFITLLLLASPLIFSTLNGQSGYRFSYISIFADPTISDQVDYYRYLDIPQPSRQVGASTSFLSKLFHNKYLYILNSFTTKYLSSFSTDFLFNQGDSNLRHGFKLFGYFYKFEFFIFLIGIYQVIKKKHKYNSFFIFLLLIAPIPFALTNDSVGPHATRLILMTLPILYIISNGFHLLLRLQLQLKFKFIFLVFYLFLISNFTNFYLKNYPHLSARAFHTGIKQSIQLQNKYKSNYDKIFVSQKFEPMLIFYLYYNQYLPNSCNINNLTTVELPYIAGKSFDNYYIGNIEWSSIKQITQDQKILFVVTQEEMESIRLQIEPLNPSIIDETINFYETEPKFILFTI